MAGGQGTLADLLLGEPEAFDDLGDGGVADDVEPRLQPGFGARGQVLADAVRVEVARAGSGVVGVRRAQGGGVGAERAVDEQVAGQAAGAERAGGVDGAQLAPVADDLGRAGAGEGEQGGEVVAAGDVGAAAFVDADDSVLCGFGEEARWAPVRAGPG